MNSGFIRGALTSKDYNLFYELVVAHMRNKINREEITERVLTEAQEPDILITIVEQELNWD